MNNNFGNFYDSLHKLIHFYPKNMALSIFVNPVEVDIEKKAFLVNFKFF